MVRTDRFGLYGESSIRVKPSGWLTLDQALANLLALAAVCPFVGSLSDLLGRRYVALTGAFFIVLGMVVTSTADNMNILICRSSHIIFALRD